MSQNVRIVMLIFATALLISCRSTPEPAKPQPPQDVDASKPGRSSDQAATESVPEEAPLPEPRQQPLAPCPDDMATFLGGVATIGPDPGEDEERTERFAVDGFCLDKIEVTAAAYNECAAAGECEAAGSELRLKGRWMPGGEHCTGDKADRSEHPINCINFAQAKAYCRWKGKRLPTAIEWEYAAVGSEGRRYPWGDAKLDETRANWGARTRATASVGSFPAGRSAEGVDDLIGNVREFTSTVECYKTIVEPECTDQAVTLGGDFMTERGWLLSPRARTHMPFDRKWYDVGVRCAK